MRNYIASLIILFIPVLQVFAEITEQGKKNLEAAVQKCEADYRKALSGRAKIEAIKDPGLFGSREAKDRYKNKQLYLKTFDQQMADFAKMTNDKVFLRTEVDVKKLQEKLAAYSSNCTRFSQGIQYFPDWALTGKAPSGYSVIFQDWISFAKCGKIKC